MTAFVAGRRFEHGRSRSKMSISVATKPVPERHLRFADGAAFIDGEYVPIREAKISVLDWGFIRSDVTYDVVHMEGPLFPPPASPRPV
jgi:hypothetical protein